MALFIDNEDVVTLAAQLVAATGKTKVAVVKEALALHLQQIQSKPSLSESIRALQAKVKDDGFIAPGGL
ncbi:type II toxin-antitoxin system VapB family antitoxin [Paracoccus sp. TOH]|uniref:type II toxin-antitoxin system VapB family antitoxin n=1 Tax=Paracoccus sp. TOH TaxID=1263728 RepID=UPI0025B1C351|nr:type II toxin-antitoxin system VapB family antitoxin [Paracoccus sp. TOH]WJS87172.1 type II toxin-antitoxin system VapB family antitoxin [Paracoccus sp. TOH]